ncbi:KAP P-loop domain-containing protein [Marinilabilia salmonicolor]|uniref:KAP P-loop domain-containing protein n=1 Tax=Marinilabilia salmonicolor TaxID=989 RepID=UPI00029AABA2|nr:KAP P-loop domain-containing protein [Marinilabilia salmonicolor]
MNDNLIKIISQYLEIETNYAVIINGDYGIGKTHFFKQDLSQKIKEISLPKNNEKKYTPIHISLFGLKTLEEIQTAIFVELYPILKNKNVKLAAGIGKSIIRGIAQLNNAGDIDKYIGDITQDPNDWLNYDELVICFDDLDRKSQTLDIRDIFGFINSLVENQGVKILIIANEEQLIKDEYYSSKLREKVIGVSVMFAPDPSKIFDQIISDRYEARDTIYFKFLKTCKTEIVSVVEKNKNNLRNLIFFLEHFRTIFYPIEKEFQEDEQFSYYKEDKMLAILNFSLAVAIEYKLGLLNSTNLEAIKNANNNSLFSIDFSKLHASSVKQSDEQKEPSYIELFKEKYYSEKEYYFFKSIFDYITGAKAFVSSDLKNELSSYFITEEGQIPKQELLLRELSYFDCLKLKNSAYRKKTFLLLSYLDNGLFQLNQYGTIFHFITRFDNLLNLDLENLKKRIKKGIRKGASNYRYDNHLGFHMSVSQDTEFREHLVEIVEYCLTINETLKNKNEENTINEYFDLFLNDFDRFEEKVRNKDDQLQFRPFWNLVDLTKVFRRIKGLENDQIWKLGHYFSDRYRVKIFERLYPEKEFIKNILNLIDNGTKSRAKKNLKNASLNYLSNSLSNSLKNFNE